MKETLQILDELLDEDDKQLVLDILHHVSIIDDDNEFLKHLLSLQKCRLTGEIIVVPTEKLNMLNKNDIRALLKEINLME